jgi:hypothetical protein
MKKSLSDILAAGADRDRLRSRWANAAPAEDFAQPLPRGEYIAHLICGELFNSAHGTLGYKLTFQVIEGEHVGRKLWHDVWLSEAAISMAKRDLAKLGIMTIDQLDNPMPSGIRCKVKLVVRKDDDGTERNRVVTFAVVQIDVPELDPFAIVPTDEAAGIVEPSPPTAAANALPATNDTNQSGRTC